MEAWAVVAHRAPLERIELPDPRAQGSEAVVEVTHCGVCHSDLYLWHGGYDLGGGRIMSLKDRGLVLPVAPGHEIVGRVVEVGPDAVGVAVGDARVVYPWVGCGHCDRCAAGEDNMCAQQRSLGVSVYGGFARRVKVPHPRYLLSYDDVDPALAATYACSGITTYSAVRKVLPLRPDQAVVLFGAGGLGLAAISMLRAFGHANIVVVDINPDNRAAALAAGATQAVDGGASTRAELLALPAPVAAAIDFVGASATAETALAILPKGGKLILVGVGGGELTLSVAGTVFRSLTVQGSLTGTVQDLREVLELARSGRLAPTPIRRMPKREINAAIQQLEHGRVTGRVVLVDADSAP